MTRFQQSLKWRLIALCVIVLMVIITLIHVTVYVTTRHIIEEQLQRSAQAVAVSIACYITEDIENYESFIRDFVDTPNKDSKYADTAYYKRMQAFFAKIKANSNVKYIYTEQRIDDKNIVFILDAEPVGASDHSPPASLNPNDQWRERVYTSGKISVGYRSVHYSRWGHLIVAYAPIFDCNEKFLGLIGVNIEAQHLFDYLNRLQMVLFVIYTTIVGIVCFVLIRYSNVILEPMLKDKLTGAYTKRCSEKLIHEEIAAAVKGHKDLALMMLDLDHFKNINDTYGHGFGDIVLHSVSESIKRSLREKDYLIRYGGEEFIAVIPGVNEKRAVEIAERIRLAVEEGEIFNEEKSVPVKMTISIGIANLNDSAISVNEFINRADQTLYHAKKNRNCVALFAQDAATRQSWVRKRATDDV
jgi:diguanylate cyclase (GGDEF)-like protein